MPQNERWRHDSTFNSASGIERSLSDYTGPMTARFQHRPHWSAALLAHLYAIADRELPPGEGDPEIIFCVDEFGPLNLQLRPGRQWAPVSGKNKEPGRLRPRYTGRTSTVS
jgi:hypothetical protein